LRLTIEEVQKFGKLVKRTGCIDKVKILGESDGVAYANLISIEDIIGNERDAALKKRQNFIVAVGMFDAGAKRRSYPVKAPHPSSCV